MREKHRPDEEGIATVKGNIQILKIHKEVRNIDLMKKGLRQLKAISKSSKFTKK